MYKNFIDNIFKNFSSFDTEYEYDKYKFNDPNPSNYMNNLIEYLFKKEQYLYDPIIKLTNNDNYFDYIKKYMLSTYEITLPSGKITTYNKLLYQLDILLNKIFLEFDEIKKYNNIDGLLINIADFFDIYNLDHTFEKMKNNLKNLINKYDSLDDIVEFIQMFNLSNQKYINTNKKINTISDNYYGIYNRAINYHSIDFLFNFMMFIINTVSKYNNISISGFQKYIDATGIKFAVSSAYNINENLDKTILDPSKLRKLVKIMVLQDNSGSQSFHNLDKNLLTKDNNSILSFIHNMVDNDRTYFYAFGNDSNVTNYNNNKWEHKFDNELQFEWATYTKMIDNAFNCLPEDDPIHLVYQGDGTFNDNNILSIFTKHKNKFRNIKRVSLVFSQWTPQNTLINLKNDINNILPQIGSAIPSVIIHNLDNIITDMSDSLNNNKIIIDKIKNEIIYDYIIPPDYYAFDDLIIHINTVPIEIAKVLTDDQIKKIIQKIKDTIEKDNNSILLTTSGHILQTFHYALKHIADYEYDGLGETVQKNYIDWLTTLSKKSPYDADSNIKNLVDSFNIPVTKIIPKDKSYENKKFDILGLNPNDLIPSEKMYYDFLVNKKKVSIFQFYNDIIVSKIDINNDKLDQTIVDSIKTKNIIDNNKYYNIDLFFNNMGKIFFDVNNIFNIDYTNIIINKKIMIYNINIKDTFHLTKLISYVIGPFNELHYDFDGSDINDNIINKLSNVNLELLYLLGTTLKNITKILPNININILDNTVNDNYNCYDMIKFIELNKNKIIKSINIINRLKHYNKKKSFNNYKINYDINMYTKINQKEFYVLNKNNLTVDLSNTNFYDIFKKIIILVQYYYNIYKNKNKLSQAIIISNYLIGINFDNEFIDLIKILI